MAGFDDLGSRLGEILLVFHISFDLADGFLVTRDLDLLVQVDFLCRLLTLVIQQFTLELKDFRLNAELRQFLEDADSVGIPGGRGEDVDGLDRIVDLFQLRVLFYESFKSFGKRCCCRPGQV